MASFDGTNPYITHANIMRSALADPGRNTFEHTTNWPAFQALLPRNSRIKNILDFGCGPGNFTLGLRQLYLNAQIVGVDASQAMLPTGEESYGTALRADDKIKFDVWDGSANMPNILTKFQPPAPGFDLITAKLSIHYLSPSEFTNAVKRISSLLCPGGALAVTVPHPDISLRFVTLTNLHVGQYTREIGNTGINGTMVHWPTDYWVDILASTITYKDYMCIIDEPMDTEGNKKRLNLLFCPAKFKPSVIQKQLQASRNEQQLPKAQSLLGRLGLKSDLLPRTYSCDDTYYAGMPVYKLTRKPTSALATNI